MLEVTHPTIEQIPKRLDQKDWPKEYHFAFSDFFYPLTHRPEVILGYAGVMSDLTFSLDVVLIAYDHDLEQKIIESMDQTGRRFAFVGHHSQLIQANLDKVASLATGFEKQGKTAFIAPGVCSNSLPFGWAVLL